MHVFMLVDMVFDMLFEFVDMFSKISHFILLLRSASVAGYTGNDEEEPQNIGQRYGQ